MNLGDMVVGVFLKFDSSGVGVMQRLSTATQRANEKLALQRGEIDKNAVAMREYNRRIEAANMGWMRLGTNAAAAIAVLGGAAIGYGVNGAAQMQRALTSSAIALHIGNTGAGMNSLYRMAFNVSGMTAQDSLTIANEMAAATTSGLNNTKALLDAFPRIAKAADVLWMSPKHIDPVEAVKQMSTLSHLFGQYQGPAFQHMLDRATEMMYVQPEGLQQLVTQGRLFLPPALSRGVSEEDIFRQAMTMGQTGFLRSRGGSGLANVIEYLGGAESITGHLSKVQHKAMYDLGLTSNGVLKPEYYNHGHLLLQKVVDHLEKLRGSMDPANFSNAVTNAFLKQGGRYMLDILLPNVYAKSRENWTRMNELGGVDKMWKQYTNNFIYQFSIFTTNFSNLFKTIFLPTLPGLTDLFKNLGQALGSAVSFLSDHPGTAKAIADTIMALTALSGIRVGAGVLVGFAKFSGILKDVAEGAPFLARFGTLMDNVFLLGLGRKLPLLAKFGGVLFATEGPLASTTAGMWGLRLALLGLLPVVGALALTSFMSHKSARQDLIDKYGYSYWRYLKGRHPGDLPYSFDRSQGDLDPISWRNMHNPRSHWDPKTARHTRPYFSKKFLHDAKQEVHVHGNVVAILPQGSSKEQTVAFVRSLTGQQGAVKTVPWAPWMNFTGMGLV